MNNTQLVDLLIFMGQSNMAGRGEATLAPMQQAQEELAEVYPDIVMVSRKFKTFAAKGMMKDRFHYLQAAYNEVGEEAGRNAAAYWEK